MEGGELGATSGVRRDAGGLDQAGDTGDDMR